MFDAQKPARVLGIGEGLIEIGQLQSGSARVGFGGDTLNTAVYMARLLGPEAVDYLTALGMDELSDTLLAAWAEEGVGTSAVARLAGRLPGLYWVMTDRHGERRFRYWRGESAARQMFAGSTSEAIAARLSGYHLIYLSGISLAILPRTDRAKLIEALGMAREAGARIAFDSNYRPALWENADAARMAMASALRVTDIALVSASDEADLWEDDRASTTMARIRGCGVRECVVKDEGNSCLVHDGQAEQLVAPPLRVTPTDTTAAGDSFNAAYLCARLRGEDVRPAALRGHALAGMVVQYPGAIIPRDAPAAGLASR